MLSRKLSLAVLGSTGSIGVTSLKIIKKYSNFFNVDLLACNKNKKIIFKQIKEFLPKYVIINDKKNFNFFKKIKFKKKIKFFQNLKDFNNEIDIKFDKVILGISSIDGLDYAFSFIKYSKEILLANKETIVCGGTFFLKRAFFFRCKITPIDSEHYCLASTLKNFKLNEIDSIYLTASGGPFLNKSKNLISKIDQKSALNHPNWKMGKKISIDSATMANKGLEVIEAAILFNLKTKNIKIKIHKESKVHSVVILKNGLVYLVAHNTSMSIPIKNSLIDDNEMLKNEKSFFCSKKNFIFSFDEKKLTKFKMVSLAYTALNYGQRACIFYNVINDFLVNMYLNKKIFFFEIHSKLNKVLLNKNLISYFKKKVRNLNDIKETIKYAKSYALKI